MQLPKIDSKLKTSVINEWLNIFPELSKYKPTMLLCRNGAVLTGIEFQWLMGNAKYRPCYVMIPLLPDVSGLVKCFLFPFEDARHRTLDIPISVNSLNSVSIDSKNYIRKLVLDQAIAPFDEQINASKLAQRIIDLIVSGDKNMKASPRSIYKTLLFLAGKIKSVDEKYSRQIFDFAIERLRILGEDKYVKARSEKVYGKSYDELIKSSYDDYESLDYNELMYDTIAKFKLDKIKCI